MIMHRTKDQYFITGRMVGPNLGSLDPVFLGIMGAFCSTEGIGPPAI